MAKKRKIKSWATFSVYAVRGLIYWKIVSDRYGLLAKSPHGCKSEKSARTLAWATMRALQNIPKRAWASV